ncbi:Crp/Fnr family transcriptional regulator [Chryseobacterium sp. LAM-KRS1]|uniref:Crp/Fnr family transcriptional regulator n=1 Tax=Chryseobacterium sp. LAM-KRS1 TaxID=2715754 RepID=UPI001553BB83|nr:Crp/Fnr family transcriptional regulator [Chryseobacterium sp. LAM-KRS1]
MYEPLINFIKNHSKTPLTDNDLEIIKDVFIPKKIRKKQYFLQEGDVCKYSGFILKGAMRQYTVDDKETEHIMRLSIENWWVNDRESFGNGTPSIYNIDAWEDTDLLVVSREDIVKLESITALNEMGRQLDFNHAYTLQRRLNASISKLAEQRYKEFSKLYPEFLQRFPQHIIASYLGMTKETLSRLRRNSLRK